MRNYRPPVRCKHLQGTHCVKLGVKCVEKRMFLDGDVCSIKESVELKRPKPPSTPPRKYSTYNVELNVINIKPVEELIKSLSDNFEELPDDVKTCLKRITSDDD